MECVPLFVPPLKGEVLSEARRRGSVSSIYMMTYPREAIEMILAWAVIHQDELMQNRELARDRKSLNPIAPLM